MGFIRGKDLEKALSKEKAEALEINAESDFELTKIKKGLWILEEKALKKEKETEKTENGLDEKIFEILEEKKLSDRVIGRFEKFLRPEELERFKELVKQGIIFEFKLSDKYKKGIYKIKASSKNFSEKNIPEIPEEEYCLEKHGLAICTTKAKAFEVSSKNSEAIKNSEIKGIKSFDGNYYIIETGLLEKYIPIVSETIQKNKNISLEELYKKAGINKILAKIICEFLKEEGDLIEKTKGRYTYV